MKKSDAITIIVVAAVVCGFAFIPGAWEWFTTATTNHGYVMAFFKFSILAVFGEMLALRIRKGVWHEQGFGVLPRMIVWGVLGVCIAMAMCIFKTGVPTFLATVCGGDPDNFAEIFKSPELTWGKAGIAFAVSVIMNTIFAPVMMTFHKITDIHIAETGGSLKGFFGNKLKMRETMSQKINWDTQYGFVFAKTIPLFWYPAHTITFLLSDTYQVLFAAFLGVALGVILSIKK